MIESVDNELEPIFISENKFIISIGVDGQSLVAIDRTTNNRYYSKDKHKESITCLSNIGNDDEKFLTGSSDQSINLWFFDGQEIFLDDSILFDEPITHLASHPRLQAISVCTNRHTIHLRQLSNRMNDELKIELKDSELTSLVIAEDQLVYGTTLGKIYVWNYENPKDPVFMLYGHNDSITKLYVSKNSLVSTAENDTAVCIWNLKTGKLGFRIELPGTQYSAAHYDAASYLMILASKNRELIGYAVRAKKKLDTKQLGFNIISIKIINDQVIAIGENMVTDVVEKSDYLSQVSNDVVSASTESDSDLKGQNGSTTCILL